MARKLKSDRVLFTATVLLVCVSVVMVYSASALVALQRFDQPNLFLTKQALWTVLGHGQSRELSHSSERRGDSKRIQLR